MNTTRVLARCLPLAALLTVAACGDDDTTSTVPDTAAAVSSAAPATEVPTVESASALVVDKSEADAQAAVEAAGWSFRVVRRDGEDLMATMDLQPERVNVEVEDGTVVAVTSIG
ncbi:MAG: hypothetical protein ABW195_07300 [Ilumatobacteraceae bacterium]